MSNTTNLDIRKREDFRRSLSKVRRSLLSGGVIVFPTDTLYGLGVDPFNPEAVDKLYSLKQRDQKNPILVLISSVKQLDLFSSGLNETARTLVGAFWPGPLTLLLPALPSLPPGLTAGTGKIGIRLPGSPDSRYLLEELGPLTATSANLTNGPAPESLQEVPTEIADQCDFLIDGGAASQSQPSTLLDTLVTPPALIREGVLSRAQIESRLGQKITGSKK